MRVLYAPLVFSLVVLCVSAVPARAEYTAEQIVVLPEGSARVVRAVSDDDEIVGGARIQGRHQGFRAIRKNLIDRVEGLPGSDYSNALGINQLGEIVGSANGDRGVRAFRSGGKGQSVDLGVLPGDQSSEALALNRKGEAAGYSSGVAGVRAVTWSRSGAMSLLPALPGADSAKALAINERGDIVGISGGESSPRAVRWSAGAVHDLGARPGDSASEALAINANGDIVGSSGDPVVMRLAVLWNANGIMEELGALPGGDSSRAFGINNRGEVVGVSRTSHGSHAFIWTREEGMRNLNDLVADRSGYVLTQAVSINDRGVILALGQEQVAEEEGHSHDLHELPIQVFLLRPER